jgi:hypothetical protein
MATTTNYGWTTPDDTALVKDGAAAIRTLGSSVDTTTKNLNPETTLGDIAYRSSTANVNTRLALGTANQQLRVNSGATAPEWFTPAASGGMTLLSTTTLSGASTTISSIDQTYKSLIVQIFGVTNATAAGTFRCAPNSQTALSTSFGMDGSGSVTTYAAEYIRFSSTSATWNNADSDNAMVLTIFNYADTVSQKPFHIYGGYRNANGMNFGGYVKTATAISSLVFSNTGGNFSTGTVKIYGAN